jgi:hypothetical protein
MGDTLPEIAWENAAESEKYRDRRSTVESLSVFWVHSEFQLELFGEHFE